MPASIYKTICDNYINGELKDGFTLRGLMETPGEQDGKALLKDGPKPLNAMAVQSLAHALQTSARGEYETADSILCALCREFPAIMLSKEMHAYITRRDKRFDAESIYKAAKYLMLRSSDIECVKIGLLLMSELRVTEANDIEIIRRLGLCEEFTLYSILNMISMDKGNDMVFSFARKLRGWGRLHAVIHIRPETDEIKYWLLTEGTRCAAAPYSAALACLEKSGAADILAREMNDEEFHGIGRMIKYLAGTAHIKESEIAFYLEHAEKHALSWEDIETLLAIRDSTHSEKLRLASTQLLLTDTVRETVTAAVKRGEALQAAHRLGVPFQADLYSLLKTDFDHAYMHFSYLLSDHAYFNRAFALWHEKMPVLSFDSNDRDHCLKMDALLTAVDAMPLCFADYVAAAIKSKQPELQKHALRVLESWTKIKEMPLRKLSVPLYTAVKKNIDPDILKESEVLRNV